MKRLLTRKISTKLCTFLISKLAQSFIEENLKTSLLNKVGFYSGGPNLRKNRLQKHPKI